MTSPYKRVGPNVTHYFECDARKTKGLPYVRLHCEDQKWYLYSRCGKCGAVEIARVRIGNRRLGDT